MVVFVLYLQGKFQTILFMKTVAFVALFILSLNVSCQTAQKTELKLGDVAPELSFTNPEGKVIALSSLKGQLVLIDFWASWCGPCRRENPSVVKTYNEFKDKSFTQGSKFAIYSVSLDKDLNAWKSAIVADNLSWTTHVSDLGGWQSKGAVLYGVNSIPSNYLINDKGVIIAKNLRGEELYFKIKSLVK